MPFLFTFHSTWQEMLESFVIDIKYYNFNTLYVVSASAVVLSMFGYSQIRRAYKKRVRRALIKERNKRRLLQMEALKEKLKVDRELLNVERDRITSLTPLDLISELKAGSITAVEAVQAFQAKALLINAKCNCIVEFIEDAEAWARELDNMPGKTLPLHGLPISVKEDFSLVDHDVTLGFTKWMNIPSKSDAVIITALKRLGAIPFCRTNFPQSLFSFGSSNPIYGTTKHPTHPDRGAGGSSSGEGALIASGGSVLGVGSDSGGSVRIPAHFCGIVGFKPTAGRFSIRGKKGSLPGSQGLCASPGLMGQDVDIVSATAKELFRSEFLHKLDPNTVPIAWKDEVYESTRPLRIGLVSDFACTPATPGCKRAAQKAAKLMEDAGHTIVPFDWDPKETFDILELMYRLILADDGRTLKEFLGDEDVNESIWYFYAVACVPLWLRKLAVPFLKWFGRRIYITGNCHSHDLWQGMVKRLEHIERIMERWQELKLDVLITPAFACPAIAPRYPSRLIYFTFFTKVFNFFNFPAGVVPVTHETAEDQRILLHSYNTENDFLLRSLKEATLGGEGLPLGAQMVALPWEEELLLRAMRDLQQAVRANE